MYSLQPHPGRFRDLAIASYLLMMNHRVSFRTRSDPMSHHCLSRSGYFSDRARRVIMRKTCFAPMPPRRVPQIGPGPAGSLRTFTFPDNPYSCITPAVVILPIFLVRSTHEPQVTVWPATMCFGMQPHLASATFLWAGSYFVITRTLSSYLIFPPLYVNHRFPSGPAVIPSRFARLRAVIFGDHA